LLYGSLSRATQIVDLDGAAHRPSAGNKDLSAIHLPANPQFLHRSLAWSATSIDLLPLPLTQDGSCAAPPGGVAVHVEGGLGITASVLGTIDGSFVSALGGVLLLADGDVSGTVSAGDDRVGIGLVSWGSVSASLTAANGPPIVAFAYDDVSGPIQADNEVHVNTWGLADDIPIQDVYIFRLVE
jgi:hypothetical protein